MSERTISLAEMNNGERGRAGIEYFCGIVFVWPASAYFYDCCTLQEWLTGVHEF